MRSLIRPIVSLLMLLVVLAVLPLLVSRPASASTPYNSALSYAQPVAKPTPPPCPQFQCVEDPFTHRFTCDVTPNNTKCMMGHGSLSCTTTAC